MTSLLNPVLSAVEGHNSHHFPLLNKKHQKIFEIKRRTASSQEAVVRELRTKDKRLGLGAELYLSF